MRKISTSLVAIILAFSLAGFPIGAESLPYAHAATTTGSSAELSSPYDSTYVYYSDLAFRDGGTATLAVGKTKKLVLINLAGDISWTSSDSSVATVTQQGVVKAKKAGVTRVTARNLKSHRSVTCTVKVYKKCTQAQARKAILSLKKAYYPGRRWTNTNYYFWQAANCHCYGCIAFVGIASDKAFGKFAPMKRHATFSKIKVGDHVRIGGAHSVIVLYKKEKSIVVAEGNYNSTFNWGRSITYSSLKRQGFYVETRY